MILKKLITLCIKKDPLAQEEIYRLYASKLFAVCLKYSRNKQEAQDNFQDGFIKIFDKIDQFRFKGSFEGWMKRIMVNTVLRAYRQKTMLSIVTDEIPDEVEVLVDDADVSLDFLLGLINQLPDRYRLVFSLYVLDDYSHKEIASMLLISEGTSKSNLSRARVILKKKIEQYYEERKTV